MARFRLGDSDHIASDDLDTVLEYTRQTHAKSINDASSSRMRDKPDCNSATPTEFDRKNERISSRIAELDAEVLGCRADIAEIEDRIDLFLHERAELERQLTRSRTQSGAAKGKGKAEEGINYMTGHFDWSEGLKARMKAVFGIDSFRLCQEGVCNANMDGRDIVCIMPTGGGKSLTYQLPALITAGCTLVISPLISLMTDQILHLREANVEAVMISGSTSRQEKEDITRRLNLLAERKPDPKREGEIKLCYVTPEKMSKDSSFRGLLQKLDAAKKFARIVIDEAHCVSQLGHDFRPDYDKLRILRKLYPRVPIMALSATCGPQVLLDLIKILGLNAVVDGTNAPTQGTTYFSSPLYRKNLHYRVASKPDKAADHLEAMRDYILQHHPNDTGIIYCFTTKDTEVVAQKLREISGGKIKTGIYHSKIADAEKENLHKSWRRGIIKVVCATIAFGLGIDKGDVRFVLHHSISKSLEGFYQESGRAGRDGKDSDCVLYYRPQDASSLSAITAHEKEGQTKLHAMLDFAENLDQCRKIQFAKYFSHSSQLSISSWTTEDADALEPCGHCDNCSRPPETVERKDVTLATWQILKIIDAVRQTGGKLTLGMLSNLARGLGGASYDVSQGRKQKAKEKFTLDLEAVSGGRVDLSRTEIEHLVVHLLTHRYLQEEYHDTAYSRLVYIAPGQLAARLSHHTLQTLRGDVKRKLEFLFVTKMKTSGRNKAADTGQSSLPKKRKSTATSSKEKGKTKAILDSRIDSGDGDEPFAVQSDEDEDEEGYEAWSKDNEKPTSTKQVVGKANFDDMYVSDSEDEDGLAYAWSHSLLEEPRPKRRRKSDTRDSNVFTMNIIKEGDNEVMVLSD